MGNEKDKARQKAWYNRNKLKLSAEYKEKYKQNRESILLRRKELLAKEPVEKREKRLAFHKEYNRRTRPLQRELFRSDAYRFNAYKASAKRRNYQFTLTTEEFTSIFHKECHYCGVEDSRGVDRVENAKGYTLNNSVPCCEMCNKMKWKWSADKFLKQVALIHAHSTKT